MALELYKGTDWFPTETVLESPEDCIAAYNQGLAGTLIDEEAKEELVAQMEFKAFSDIMSMWGREGIRNDNPTGGLYLNGMAAVLVCEALEKGVIQNADVTPELIARLSADERLNPWNERQTTGDCVSHGTRNHNDYVRGTEIVFLKELEEWIRRTATEIHYGDRGHSGQGASSGRLRNFTTNVGGMFIRKNYPELGVDLSVYNAKIGMSMGRTGVPQKFIEYSKPNNIRKLTQCRSIEEAIAAFRAGFCCSGGGMHSFSESRDANGFSKWTGASWAHDTAQSAMDERPEIVKLYGGRLFLYQNSWGKWNNGGRKILGTNILIPHGSMWIHEKDYARMIQNGDYFIAAGANGWKPVALPDFGFTGRI